jgi:3-hydroxyisobutyrate dehydrogenase-like beta-hydroxyacid dehydrogenase
MRPACYGSAGSCCANACRGAAMTTGNMPSVGFAGLGNIGLPMAMRLHEMGHKLIVWNRSPARRQPFVNLGVGIAQTPSALAAQCDIVCLCLSSAEAVTDVVFGDEGIACAHPVPHIVIDHSTISPDETRRIGRRLADQTGIAWLDAPVSGGPTGARAGTLAIMVGGRQKHYDQAAPVLQSLAGKLTLLGGQGMGQLAKAANQIINFITAAAIGEAFAVAQAAGLPPQVLAEALAGGFADSNALREYTRAYAAGEQGGLKGLIEAYADVGLGHFRPAYAGTLDILQKDIAIAADVARKHGVPIPLLHQVETLGRMLHYQRPAPE